MKSLQTRGNPNRRGSHGGSAALSQPHSIDPRSALPNQCQVGVDMISARITLRTAST